MKPSGAGEPHDIHDCKWLGCPQHTFQPAQPAGEWTAQTVFDIMGTDYGDGWKRERLVASAHNAAIAYEREQAKLGWERNAEAQLRINELLEQLAAAVEAPILVSQAEQIAEDVLAKIKEGK